MAMNDDVHFDIKPDPAIWVYVPLAFPWGEFKNDGQWAKAVSIDLLKGMNAPKQVRAALERAAIVMARVEAPTPGAAERYWRLAATGGPECLVHLYIGEEEARSAEEIVARISEGTEGVLQTVRVIESEMFEFAVETLVVEAIDSVEYAPFYALRLIGVFRGFLFMLEMFESDPVALQLVQQDVRALFETIRVGTPTEQEMSQGRG